jgi:hypothetical protein
MAHFIPLAAALGGGPIGVAAALPWFGSGRIAGSIAILGALLDVGAVIAGMAGFALWPSRPARR